MALHPLHPMSVHAPLTCMLGVPFLDAAALCWRTEFWLFAACTTAAALALGVLAATLGALDFERARAKAPTTVLWHACAMGGALLCEAISLAGRLTASGLVTPAPLWAIGASALGFAIVLAGAYFGGELVYRHGVNVGAAAPD